MTQKDKKTLDALKKELNERFKDFGLLLAYTYKPDGYETLSAELAELRADFHFLKVHCSIIYSSQDSPSKNVRGALEYFRLKLDELTAGLVEQLKPYERIHRRFL